MDKIKDINMNTKFSELVNQVADTADAYILVNGVLKAVLVKKSKRHIYSIISKRVNAKKIPIWMTFVYSDNLGFKKFINELADSVITESNELLDLHKRGYIRSGEYVDRSEALDFLYTLTITLTFTKNIVYNKINIFTKKGINN